MPFGIPCKHCGALEGAHAPSNKPHHREMKIGYKINCADCPGYERLF